MGRESDMMGELFEAVFAGDLAKAEATLDLMQATGICSESIRRAKRRARPEPSVAPPVKAIPLPQPGRTATEVFGPGFGSRFGGIRQAEARGHGRKRARG